MKKNLEQLKKTINDHDVVISYIPFINEIDCTHSSFPLTLPSEITRVPNNTKIDPFVFSLKCRELYKHKNVYILIPGTQFDMQGTRHGKGTGWYDRFLSKLPESWIKVGVCFESQLSLNQLPRQPWDIPVDWLIVYNNTSWVAYDTRKK